MSVGVFPAAYLPPTQPFPAVPPREALELTWEGWDGSVWPLNAAGSTVRLTTGTKGLGKGPGEHRRDSSPALPGERWLSWQAKPRPVEWDLYVFSKGDEQAYLDQEEAFWRTMSPRRPGRFTVRAPGRPARTLTCRFESDGEWAYLRDPVRFGWARYRVSLMADDQPYWEGEPVVTAFKSAEPRSFLGGGPVGEPGAGPPLVIGSGSSFARARIDNPGDVETWVEWIACGPCPPGLQLGVNGKVDILGFEIADGRAVVLDGDPGRQWALEATVVTDAAGRPTFDEAGRVRVRDIAAPGSAGDRTHELTRLSFAPVPPGRDVPLTIRMDGGTGLVGASLVPLHDRGF
ncbi:hypothetical protein [Pseudokineococcus marinus]|uniref:Phage tail protein n=2 Tax=Pseudokineococcus marinus TaxID=351215 RepID=A0A849BKL7_9ACTN|nr:hypothetical protein [Pseudokineococcus marinus]NNH21637.1 hypothetical protein [Pseudokineococcus marinus]